jgi:hypothetical protein
VLLVMAALARQARELTASPVVEAARRASILYPPGLWPGLGYHHATPYQIVTPIRPRAITLPGSLLGLRPNPNRRRSRRIDQQRPESECPTKDRG